MKITNKLSWIEPNRLNLGPLHIGRRGVRFPTVTGIALLDENKFVALHRSGLKLGFFDLLSSNRPLVTVDLHQNYDDVAVFKYDSSRFRIALSGCWDSVYSEFSLDLADSPKLEFVHAEKAEDETFSHGVGFDDAGVLWIALHTGHDPRVMAGEKTYRLAGNFGPRKVFFGEAGRVFLVATSKNPGRKGYSMPATGVWALNESLTGFDNLFLPKGHSDSGEYHRGKVWIANQTSDELISFDLKTRETRRFCANLNFPHAVEISKNGTFYVTNYGDSSISILRVQELRKSIFASRVTKLMASVFP